MAQLKTVRGKKHPVLDETEHCAECGSVLPDDDGSVLCYACLPAEFRRKGCCG